MPRRYLNVEYSTLQARINITGMEDLSDVRRAIKAEFGGVIPGPPALIQIWRKTPNNDQLFKTWEQLDGLSPEYFKEEGGLSLTIGLALGVNGIKNS
jgi:hypothetical protein